MLKMAPAVQGNALKALAQSSVQNQELSPLKKIAQEFESLFINQILSQMRKSGFEQKQGFMPKSNAVKQFESMLDEQLARKMAQQEAFGMSKAFYQSYEAYERNDDLARQAVSRLNKMI